jgi:uncharacterized protein (TIGR02001 family)
MHASRISRLSATGALLTASLGTTGAALAESPWTFNANIGAVSNYIWRGVTQTQDGAAVQGGVDVAHESGFYAGTWASNIDWNDEGASQEVLGIVPMQRDPATGELLLDRRGRPMPVTDEDGNLVVVGETSGSSNPDSPNYELDLYLGYGGSIGEDFSYDISGIYYAYPDGRDSDFAEVGASATWKWFTLGLAYTVYGENDGGLFDDGDWYYYGGAEFTLPYDFGFSVRGGYYDFRHDDEDVVRVDVNGNPYLKTESYDYWAWGATLSKEAGDFGTFSLNYDQNSGEQDLGYDNDPKIWVGWNKEF